MAAAKPMCRALCLSLYGQSRTTSKVQIAEKKGDIAEAEAKAAKDQAKAVTMSIRATAQASPLLEQAQCLLTMNDVAGVMKPPIDARDRKTRCLDKAEAMFKLALKRSEGQVADLIRSGSCGADFGRRGGSFRPIGKPIRAMFRSTRVHANRVSAFCVGWGCVFSVR